MHTPLGGGIPEQALGVSLTTINLRVYPEKAERQL
jgi:hypothetical protein